MRYRVEVEEVRSYRRTYIVEAASRQEAFEMVECGETLSETAAANDYDAVSRYPDEDTLEMED